MTGLRYTSAPDSRIRQFTGFTAGETATSAKSVETGTAVHRLARVNLLITMKLRTLAISAAILAALSLPVSTFAKDKKSDKSPAAAFAKLDKNGDGVVTEAEYVEAMKDKLGEDGAKAHFAELDKDHDGKLTSEEFAAGAHTKKHKKTAE